MVFKMCRIKFCVDPRKPGVPINSADGVLAENISFWSSLDGLVGSRRLAVVEGWGVMAGCRDVWFGGPGPSPRRKLRF